MLEQWLSIERTGKIRKFRGQMRAKKVGKEIIISSKKRIFSAYFIHYFI